VNTILLRRRLAREGVGLVVTPNIDHIAQLRRNSAFRHAYANAEMVLCDGFPVHYYALARGHAVKRVTGCEVINCLLQNPRLMSCHRLFFVVDRERTAQAVDEWADKTGLRSQVVTRVPPFGFEADAIWSAKLADEIFAHSTTILVMAIGAPRSEIFVDQHRTSLPPCWAMYVGQAVKTAFGIVRRAPLSVRPLARGMALAGGPGTPTVGAPVPGRRDRICCGRFLGPIGAYLRPAALRSFPRRARSWPCLIRLRGSVVVSHRWRPSLPVSASAASLSASAITLCSDRSCALAACTL